ncbi:ABC transporter substrate-binding protein [Actinoplanes sp. CA-054009]
MIRRIATAALAAVLLTAAGCGDDSTGGGSKDQVTYVTAFGAVGRDAFVWVAKEKGWFADAGIDVEIQKGAGNVQNLTMIKSGQAQFGALDFTGAEIQAGLGKFTEWRAVAAVHQQTLVSIMTTADTGIKQPADLAGRTVATATGSVSELLFPAYAKLAGLDPSTVKIQGAQTTALSSLMAQRKVDALSTFLLSQKALETASKKPVVVLPYSEYLTDLFGNAVIVKADLIGSDRDLVERFVGAAMKGLQYTIDHPAEAADILHQAEPTATTAATIGEIEAMKPYVTSPGGGALGSFDAKRVEAGIAELTKNGLMPAGLTADKVVDPSFVK